MPLRKPDSEKFCTYCGTQLARKRYKGTLESNLAFSRRRFCDATCCGLANRIDEPSLAALRKRHVPFRGDTCAECGSRENVGLHHKDENPANNAPSNIVTLCGSCHTKLHWRTGKRDGYHAVVTSCSICGSSVGRMKRGMCGMHYQRWKKEQRAARA